MSTWVSVDKELPQELQTVWLTNGTGMVWLGCRVVVDGEWHDWAESQAEKGIKQTQCEKCKRWFFPSEF